MLDASDLAGILLLFCLAILVGLGTRSYLRRQRAVVAKLVRRHLGRGETAEFSITVREFPYRMRADLQRAFDRMFSADRGLQAFYGLNSANSHEEISLTDLLSNLAASTRIAPPEYEELDVGDPQPQRCLKNGLWLIKHNGVRHVVLLFPVSRYRPEPVAVRIQFAVRNSPEGLAYGQRLFSELEEAVARSESYRGKVLSLERSDAWYTGQGSGIKVHKLRSVARDQVILPAATLELLERNVIEFVHRRSALARYQQSTKKGLLFYGPPGTGKTHTIHYLAGVLPQHTTLLITAEQVGLLDEYMTLARLLQPTLVVLEDVDLIARDRGTMNTPCEESLLNKLLNEMDGLRPDAEVLFVLTTNRPEALERALASRPGRVDQAIEFPLPDEEGRRKLVKLYSQGIVLPEEVIETIVRRTEQVSAAFIKELMRRSVQFHLEHLAEATDGQDEASQQWLAEHRRCSRGARGVAVPRRQAESETARRREPAGRGANAGQLGACF